MNRKSFKDRIHRAITLARQFAKGIDRADRTYRKLVHLKTEARPANRTYIPAYIRKLVFIRDKYRCVKCGSKKDLEIHLLQEEYETAACWSTVPDTQLTDDIEAITCPACQIAVLEEIVVTE